AKTFRVPYSGNESVDYEALPTEEELTVKQPLGDIQQYIASRMEPVRASVSQDAMKLTKEYVQTILVDILRIKPSLSLVKPTLIETRAVDKDNSEYSFTKLELETEPGMRIDCQLI